MKIKSFAVTFLLLLATTPVARAAPPGCPPGTSRPSWVFDQSYYSHDPVHPVHVGGRATAGGPLFSRPQGGYYSGGFRQVRSRIQIGGMTFDQLNLWESWGQQGSQF
ncbi:MAG: hypothetical protein KF708_13515 [Pirellulales bacterium]|nr:hypothetical protein [Pirellulales bacterium]